MASPPTPPTTPSPISPIPDDEAWEAEREVRARVVAYLTSKPGPHKALNNAVLHDRCKKFLGGDDLNVRELELLIAGLNYRLFQIMSVATIYKELLGISDFPDCKDWDESDWEDGLKAEAQCQTIHPNIQELWDRTLTLKLFTEPTLDEGPAYDKGYQYLVHMLASRSWTSTEMDDAFYRLRDWKARHNMYLECLGKSEILWSFRLRDRLERWLALAEDDAGDGISGMHPASSVEHQAV